MNAPPDDLDRLPGMSPANEAIVPTRVARRGPTASMLPLGMVLSGIGILLLSGFFLLWVFALASMTDDTDPNYWSEVLNKMFGLQYGARVAIPASFGLLLGIASVVLGIYKAGAKRG